VSLMAYYFILVTLVSAGPIYAQRYEILNKADDRVIPARVITSYDSTSGQVTLEFFAEGVRASCIQIDRHDTLTIKLLPHRPDKESPITFTSGTRNPISYSQSSKVVRVLLCRDTALFEIVQRRMQCVRTSDELIVDSAGELPADVFYLQLHSRNDHLAHSLIDEALMQFSGALEVQVLVAGIYPGLEFPVVKVANFRRRQRVNETASGYLIAFRILDQQKSGEIAAWFDRQKKDP
jgi:hypothetical protein